MQFTNRFNGFVGELDFIEWFSLTRKGNDIFSGGFLLSPIEDAYPLDKPIYFTVSSDDPSRYGEIYERMAKLGCSKMFFIQWDNCKDFIHWSMHDVLRIGRSLPVPDMEVFSYDDHGNFSQVSISEILDCYTDRDCILEDKVSSSTKEMFSGILDRFDERHIKELYVQRLVFDGFIGLRKVKGIPSDLDLIVKAKRNQQYICFEVKEKDLSKTPPQGFGMDVSRIDFFKTLIAKTEIETYYIVKQIDNQRDRKLIAWRCIELLTFSRNTVDRIIEGGTGMRSSRSSNPTLICPERHFTYLQRY